MKLQDYWKQSRSILPGVLVALPLLLIYEIGILVAQPGMRNGADAYLRGFFLPFGSAGKWVWMGVVLAFVLTCIYLARREKIPAHIFLLPIAVEGLVFALFFGPVVLFLQAQIGAGGAWLQEQFAGNTPGEPGLGVNLIFAVGAGVYEEILFRLILLSLLFYLGLRTCQFFSLPVSLAAVGAVFLSALAFSAFHHLGATAPPFTWEAFLFRLVAGVLLGILFITRGFGVAVYTHAFYDILYLLTR